MKLVDCNNNQKHAWAQVIEATNYITGGYENDLADGHIDCIPSRECLIEEIYDHVMSCTTYEGCVLGAPIKEIRFVGKDFIIEQIKERLIKEGY